jgi:acyl-CoA thioester hydrolase
MLEHRYRHRVRYRECDPMGVVYHAHFVDLFEYARTEALRSHGLPYRAIEEAGIIMPVVELDVRYHRSAYYDDLLEVHVAFPEPPGVRITAQYEIHRLEPEASEAPLVSGRVMLCFVDRARQRPVRAPLALRQVFESIPQP